MWWLTNEVYWLSYGCQNTKSNALFLHLLSTSLIVSLSLLSAGQWIAPCPPNTVCSFIKRMGTKNEPYCGGDPNFQSDKQVSPGESAGSGSSSGGAAPAGGE